MSLYFTICFTQHTMESADGDIITAPNDEAAVYSAPKKASKRSTSPSSFRKSCDLCHEPNDVLVRCQIDSTETWRFICPKRCWKSVSGSVIDGSLEHPYYKYGGVRYIFVLCPCPTWGQLEPRDTRLAIRHLERTLISWLRDEVCWLGNHTRCGKTSMRLWARRNPSTNIRIAVAGWRHRVYHPKMRLGCDGLTMEMMEESCPRQDHGANDFKHRVSMTLEMQNFRREWKKYMSACLEIRRCFVQQ